MLADSDCCCRASLFPALGSAIAPRKQEKKAASSLTTDFLLPAYLYLRTCTCVCDCVCVCHRLSVMQDSSILSHCMGDDEREEKGISMLPSHPHHHHHVHQLTRHTRRSVSSLSSPFSSSIAAILIIILSHSILSSLSHPINTSLRSSSSSGPADDATCHGMQPGSLYHYQYKTHMLLNNNDQKVCLFYPLHFQKHF